MQCSQPPAITDNQLSAALDGEAGLDVLDHLAGCTSCAARYAEARTLEATLKRHLHRFGCPPTEEIADFHWGLLDADAAAAVVQHLPICPRCSAELAELRYFLTDDQAEQPQLQRGAALHRPSPRSIQARVLPSQQAVALRGAAVEPTIAEAEGHTIVLQLRKEGDHGMALVGQLLANPTELWQVALVEVRQEGIVQHVAALDQFGGFKCYLPSQQPVDLRFSAKGKPDILISSLSLPATGG